MKGTCESDAVAKSRTPNLIIIIIIIIKVTDVVGDDWGYDFVWTLRDGEQMLEQHQYMEFRYVNVHFPNGTAPKNFSVSAWQAMCDDLDITMTHH